MGKGYQGKDEGLYPYKGATGLYLRVGKTGKSVWAVRLRLPNGKRTWRNLGEAGPSFNHKAAVNAAHELLSANAQGEVKPKRERDPTTVESIVEAWLAIQKQRWSARHYTKSSQRIYSQLSKADWWPLPASRLTRQQVVLHLETTVKSKDTATRVYKFLKDALELAVDRGLLPYCVLSERVPLTIRHSGNNRMPSVGSDTEKLKLLLQTILNSNSHPSVKAAGALSILCPLRLGNVLGAQSDFVQGKTLVIPRDQMKLKEEWRGDFHMPLGEKGYQLLEPFLVNKGLLLFVRPDTQITHAAVEKMFRTACSELGCKHTPHGSRSSFMTVMREANTNGNLEAISRALDHAVRDSTRAHYDRSEYLTERALLIEDWQRIIADGIDLTTW